MKPMVICALVAAILAAPCVYDPSSREPSPLTSLFTAAAANL
jgi:hypothetical protein